MPFEENGNFDIGFSDFHRLDTWESLDGMETVYYGNTSPFFLNIMMNVNERLL